MRGGKLSKELEALKYLKSNPYLQEDRYSMEALSYFEKALTPPTEEEILTLLNKCFLDIDADYFVFESKFKVTDDLYFYRDIIMGDGSLGRVYLDDYLFGTLREYPNVLKMLGEFYEGEIQ